MSYAEAPLSPEELRKYRSYVRSMSRQGVIPDDAFEDECAMRAMVAGLSREGLIDPREMPDLARWSYDAAAAMIAERTRRRG